MNGPRGKPGGGRGHCVPSVPFTARRPCKRCEESPAFRRWEPNGNVLIGLAFHKRQIWLCAIVFVLYPQPSLPCLETRIRWVRTEGESAHSLCCRQFKRLGFSFSTYWPIIWLVSPCILINTTIQLGPVSSKKTLLLPFPLCHPAVTWLSGTKSRILPMTDAITCPAREKSLPLF